MTYTKNASGQTVAAGAPLDLWPSGNADGADTIFIQNRSPKIMTVLVTPDQVGGQPNAVAIPIDLPERGTYVLTALIVDPAAKVQIVCAWEGASFTAFRGKSS